MKLFANQILKFFKILIFTNVIFTIPTVRKIKTRRKKKIEKKKKYPRFSSLRAREKKKKSIHPYSINHARSSEKDARYNKIIEDCGCVWLLVRNIGFRWFVRWLQCTHCDSLRRREQRTSAASIDRIARSESGPYGLDTFDGKAIRLIPDWHELIDTKDVSLVRIKRIMVGGLCHHDRFVPATPHIQFAFDSLFLIS